MLYARPRLNPAPEVCETIVDTVTAAARRPTGVVPLQTAHKQEEPVERVQQNLRVKREIWKQPGIATGPWQINAGIGKTLRSR